MAMPSRFGMLLLLPRRAEGEFQPAALGGTQFDLTVVLFMPHRDAPEFMFIIFIT